MLRRGGFHKSIRALFPEVDFQNETPTGMYCFEYLFVVINFDIEYQDRSARRAFFVNYARKKGFDPLIPDNWYHQVKRSVVAEEVNTKTKRIAQGRKERIHKYSI